MGWQRATAWMFPAVLAAELLIMIGFGGWLGFDLESRATAMADAALIGAFTVACFLFLKWWSRGRRAPHISDWQNAAILFLTATAFEMALHSLSQNFTHAYSTLSVELLDAILVALVIAFVNGWLWSVDEQVAVTVGSRAHRSLAVALGSVFAMMIIAALPIIETVNQQVDWRRSKDAALLVNFMGSQRTQSQRVGRLALLDTQEARRDLTQVLLSADLYGVHMNRLAQDYIERNRLSRAEYPQLPGNDELEQARQRYLMLGRQLLAAPARERRALNEQLQQAIEEFQPLVDGALRAIETVESRRAELRSDPTGGWFWIANIILLAAGLAWPPLRLVRAQRIGLAAALDRADAALATLSTYQRALDEHAIVAITDASGIIAYVNDRFCSISGYERAELLGRRYTMLDPSFHGVAALANMQQQIRLGQIWHEEVCSRAKDGRQYWLDTAVVPARGEDGLPKEYVYICYDITERRAAQDALRHTLVELERERERLEARVEERTVEIRNALKLANAANEAKSHFLATMTHELRTPLHTILGYAEMVREDLADSGDDSANRDLTLIVEAARHLLILIGEILDFSKIEAGEVQAEIRDVDIEKFASEIASEVQVLAQKQNNELRCEIGSSLGICQTDPTRLKQCLHNLLSNAAKFTHEGTITLHVCASSRDGEDGFYFEVADTGIGMSAQTLAAIFEPFKQADESFTRKYGGTGLGLPITKQLIELLGGRLSVTSREGAGSTFTAWLPKTARAAVDKEKAA
jgi:PAS domain S-box-containing protein